MKRLATGGLVVAAFLFPVLGLMPLNGATAQCDSSCASPSRVPDGADAAAAAELLALANSVRAGSGLAPLEHRADIAEVATGHSQAMAAAGEIFHNDAYFSSNMKTRLGISAAGENVGMAGSVAAVHQALMDSPLHRANIVNGSFRVAGFGVYRKAGALYVTEAFGVPRAGTAARTAPAPRPAATAPATSATPTTVRKAAPKPTTTAAPAPAPAPPTTAAPPPAASPTVTVPATPDPTVPDELAIETPRPSTNAGAATPGAAAPALLMLTGVSVAAMAGIRRHRRAATYR